MLPRGGDSVPARRKYTRAEDGLNRPWRGRVWLNPPYSRPGPWVERMRQHGDGVALLPTSKGRWFNELFADPGCEICYLPANFKFVKGGDPHGIPLAVFLAGWGDVCQRAIRRVGPTRIAVAA